MYGEALALTLLFGVVCSQLPQSPTIDCTLQLRTNSLTSSFILTRNSVPHEITCVRSSTSVDIIVKAANGTSITDLMLQVYITGAPSGLFLSPDDRDMYAVGCSGRALFSKDRSSKRRIDALWFNSLGFDLTTKLPTCMVTLTDSRNMAWESIAVPSITNEEFERQRLNALLGIGNNMFAESAQPPPAQNSTSAASQETAAVEVAATTQPTREPAVSRQEAVPDKILDISLSSVMSQSPGNIAVRFNSPPRSSAAPSQTVTLPTQRPASVNRLRSAGASTATNGSANITTPSVDSLASEQPTTILPTAAETTTTPRPTTTTVPTTTTTTPTTTTTTPTTTTTTTTTPTTTTTTPTTTPTTTTTTTPTTTTTTPTTTTPTTTTPTTTTPTTTTSTTTTPTTTTPTTTTRPTPAARRPTRPVVVQAVTARRPTLPTTTTRRTTTTTTTTTTTPTTTTQPVNLDQGSITVQGRTYEHHCLNGNLKRVLVPHTGCRHYITLMNGLPGAFSKCPINRRDGQQCFDVVTCSCIRCHHAVCPPSFDPERSFNVTVYNSQRDPIGRIAGEFVPNRSGGYNENIQINGVTDPGYLPLRNADGSIQSTPEPPAPRRANGPSNNRRGTNRRGASNRGSNTNNQNRQRGINGVISELLNFF